MSPNTQRHKALLKQERENSWIIFVVACVVGLIMLLTMAVEGIAGSGNNTRRGYIFSDIEFWQIIDNQVTPVGRTDDILLAVALRDLIGPHDPTATVLPQAITSFTAKPDTYYSIDDDLSPTPFAGCTDGDNNYVDYCGHLSNATQTNLLLIKQGHLDTVVTGLRDELPPKSHLHFTVTPFGLPLWTALIFIWLIGTMTVFQFSRVELQKDNPYAYRLVNLEWDFDGAANTTKVANMLYGAPIVIPYLIITRLQKYLLFRKLRRQYGGHMKTYDRAGRAIRILARRNPDDINISGLRQQRSALLSSLNGLGNVTTIQAELDEALNRLKDEDAIYKTLKRDYPVHD